MEKIYKLLLIILGCALIIGGFNIFGSALDPMVQLLDIIVSCVIFIQFVEFLIFPLINIKDSSHKEVGMMGIHLYTLYICCTLSLAIMICGICYLIPFIYQLGGQLVILFLLLLGRVTTLHAGSKVEEVYNKEQNIKAGKVALKHSMDDFMDNLHSIKTLDISDKCRLQSIQDSLRFITPSNNSEAIHFDQEFIKVLDFLLVLMRDVSLNKDKITEEIGHLERILTKRKTVKY